MDYRILLVYAIVFSILSGGIAHKKGGSVIGYFLLGIILGPIAMLIAFLANNDNNKCPNCGEKISQEVEICPNCSESLAIN
ncbi:MAG: zinc ribbon domain-containing protein [candidate division KSB1 bacterium]|nr:zinc ribbon domain-containing protein [candidate division KSB1 bacterium]